MQLTKLLPADECKIARNSDADIAGISSDSRNVRAGFLFIAIPGTQIDGRTFIQDAINKGAVAVLVPDETDISSIPENVSVATTNNARTALSAIASRFYPKQPSIIAAITGTSGKTSTTQFAMELWNLLGHKAASVGTLGLVTPDEKKYGSLTTPDAITLHQILNDVSNQGITHLAMEASSHGLELNRLDNVNVKIGAFTNLSRDHLDYHKTMEEYFAAKSILFASIMKPGSTAILNADAPEYESLAAICKKQNHKIIDYGKNASALKLLGNKPHEQGQIINFCAMGKNYEVFLPVIGSFQAWNSLCALGIAIGSGENESKIIPCIEKLSGVPGRLQFIGKTVKGGAVFVDYAHKPGALEDVLKGMRPHVQATEGAKLGVVFGCGGNRDRGKRPIMGEITQRLADWAIVTDDNPRNEEPSLIRKEILAGCVRGPNLREIGDRAQAIKEGVLALGNGDVLIIAGKGHEPGQIIGDKVLPFDDAGVARKIISEPDNR